MDSIQPSEQEACDEHSCNTNRQIVRRRAKEGVGPGPVDPVPLRKKVEEHRFEEVRDHGPNSEGHEVQPRETLPQRPDHDGVEGGEGHARR